MLEKVKPAADRHATQAVKRQINRLAQTPPPHGTVLEETDSGVTLIGKRLRRRMLTDINLRNFGR